MSQPSFNQRLKVSEFLQQINWQGIRLLQIDRPTLDSNVCWHNMSVSAFFDNCNWTGQSITAESDATELNPLSMNLSVSNFFLCFSWNGIPQVASPLSVESLPEMQSTQERLTLDDFSNLF